MRNCALHISIYCYGVEKIIDFGFIVIDGRVRRSVSKTIRICETSKYFSASTNLCLFENLRIGYGLYKISLLNVIVRAYFWENICCGACDFDFLKVALKIIFVEK